MAAAPLVYVLRKNGPRKVVAGSYEFCAAPSVTVDVVAVRSFRAGHPSYAADDGQSPVLNAARLFIAHRHTALTQHGIKASRHLNTLRREQNEGDEHALALVNPPSRYVIDEHAVDKEELWKAEAEAMHRRVNVNAGVSTHEWHERTGTDEEIEMDQTCVETEHIQVAEVAGNCFPRAQSQSRSISKPSPTGRLNQHQDSVFFREYNSRSPTCSSIQPDSPVARTEISVQSDEGPHLVAPPSEIMHQAIPVGKCPAVTTYKTRYREDWNLEGMNRSQKSTREVGIKMLDGNAVLEAALGITGGKLNNCDCSVPTKRKIAHNQ
ncbi:hypothetical protein EI94DRAFT_1786698 [Lactarius quietus]|nr:hypothetical protein EI94DRAFT_1786698 [Lactarius quietus]